MTENNCIYPSDHNNNNNDIKKDVKYFFKKHRFLLADILFFIVLVFISGFIGLSLGDDANWDLANYHYYAPWAIFHNRIGFDIMPSGIQSYYNPLIDFPLYFLIKYFNNHSWIISFYQSLWYGIAVFLVYKISSLVFTGKMRGFFIFISVLIGATCVTASLEIGTSFGDGQTASGILFAIFIFIKNIFTKNSKKRTALIFLAALLLGIMTEIKKTNILAAVGLLLAEIILFKKYEKPVKTICITTFGIGLGILLTGGWWYYIIYSNFGNPFFPLYNNIFKSPFALTEHYLDQRFLPTTLIKYLFFPILFPLKGEYVLDYHDINPRFLFAALSVVILAIRYSIRFLRTTAKEKIVKEDCLNDFINKDIFLFLLLMVTISYLYWFKLFCIVRYLTFIDLMSGIFILILPILLKSKIKIILITLQLTSFILFSTRYNYTHEIRTDTREKYIDFENFNLPDDSVILFIGGFPGTIFMPFQNPNARYIYLYGEANYNFKYSDYYIKQVKEIIKNAGNKVYVLYSGGFEFAKVEWDYVIPLNKNDFNCREAKNNVNIQYFFCSLKEGKTVKTE